MNTSQLLNMQPRGRVQRGGGENVAGARRKEGRKEARRKEARQTSEQTHE